MRWFSEDSIKYIIRPICKAKMKMSSEQTPKKHSEEIRERREQVASLMKFKTGSEIAKDLDCSLVTVARDIAFLKKSARYWLDDLARDGFIYEYKISLDELKENRAKLKKLYENATDPFEKRTLLKDIDANILSYIKLLSEAPTVLAFKRKTGGAANV